MLRLTRRLRRSNAASAASLEDISSRSTPHQQHSGQGVNWQRRSVENRGTISRQEHQPPRHQRPLNLAPRAPIRESSAVASGTVGESSNNQNRQQQRGRDRKVRAPAAPSRENGELDAKGAHLDDIDPRPWHQRTFESVDLICSICLEAFNRPITLPCWHSFCLLCLQNFLREYQQQSFSCPQCRQVVEVPAGGLRDFPCNPRLKEALELHEKRRAVLIKRAAARISSDESSSSKDNPNEDPGLDPAELREVLLTGISLLRSEALEKIEIVKASARSNIVGRLLATTG